MTENPRTVPGPYHDDDVQGHVKRRADAESAEGGDTEGHMPWRYAADTESAEGDDTGGHAGRYTGADAEKPEGDDTEGHGRSTP